MNFIDFARAHGIEIEQSRLAPSDKIKRCGTTEKPKGTAGAYFWDGERGWVFNWSTEARVQWFEDKNAKAWTEEEKRAWSARRQSAAAEQEAKHRNSALAAQMMIRASKPGPHDYLIFKGFPGEQGLVLEDGTLAIPMRSVVTNELQGVQLVHWNAEATKWEKKMTPGMRAKGAVLRLGDKTAPETFLVEGYATGLSVLAALRSVGLRASVLVCFSAGNLVHVAPMIKGKCFVFADNDRSETGEKSAKETGLSYCMADEVGFDANDLHQKHGLMAVCKKLMEVRRIPIAA